MLTRMTSAIAATALALLSSSASAVGVCYSPFHSTLYFSSPSQIESILVRDFQTIAAQGFTSVRTYHAQFYGYNVVRAAQQTGLHVTIGIQMTNSVGSGEYEFLQQDIDAAIYAGNSSPELVDAIYAGNENLKNGDHGFASADRIIQVIQQVRSGLTNKQIPVGTVQRLEEWLTSADADKLAANSDVVGANIYPFFTHGGQYDMKGQLDAQWSKFTAKYGSKARLTETGWATEGSTLAAGNVPSLDTATQYYQAFLEWSKSSGAHTPYYFMMFDVPSAGGDDYEKHFGLATSDGVMKFDNKVKTSSSEVRENDASSSSSSATSSSSSPETPPPVEGPLDTVVPPTETPEPTTNSPTVPPTTNEPTPTPTITPTITPAPTHATGSSSSGSGSHPDDIVVPTSLVPSSNGSGDSGYEPTTPTKTHTPTPTPSHATVPAPTTLSPEAQAAKDAAAREASSREARAVSGGSGVSFFMFGSVAAVMGVVAIVVIAVYMKRQAQDEGETRTVAASSIDPRASTPSSVYDDPLGTRFSSIVMITPNGDGVCIL